jgi:hypothetical protein
MMELGFRESLGAETELPDKFLPQEYLALFKG